MPNVSSYLTFSAQWLKGREPGSCKEKQKGKLIWKMFLLLIFLGLVGFLDVHECLSRMLSDDSMSLIVMENINTVWPGITNKARSCTKY